MNLKEFLDTCGNDWRFIKIYFATNEERDFDKIKPDYFFSNNRFSLIHDPILEATVKCWHIDRKANDLEVLLG